MTKGAGEGRLLGGAPLPAARLRQAVLRSPRLSLFPTSLQGAGQLMGMRVPLGLGIAPTPGAGPPW